MKKRWYLSAAAAGALLAGAALWAARTFLAASAAVPGFFGLAGGLLFFCAMAELLSTRDLDPAMASRPEPMPQSIPPRESGTRPSSSRDRTSRTMPMARSPWNRRFFCVRFIQSPSFNTDGGTRR